MWSLLAVARRELEMSVLFDAMGAMSAGRNDDPEHAARAFDTGRDGFVSPVVAACLVLESLSTPRRAAPPSSRSWSALAPRRTATTWSPRPAKAPCAACSRPQHRQDARGLPPHPRHLDPGGRRRRTRRRARSLWRQRADDQLHQVHLRPLARRRRRAGGHLLAADAARRLRHRVRQHREPRPAAEGLKVLRERHDGPINTGDVQQLWLWRDERDLGVHVEVPDACLGKPGRGGPRPA